MEKHRVSGTLREGSIGSSEPVPQIDNVWLVAAAAAAAAAARCLTHSASLWHVYTLENVFACCVLVVVHVTSTIDGRPSVAHVQMRTQRCTHMVHRAYISLDDFARTRQ